MKKATMKDIAAAAGVSIATVSYVLNNKEKEKINEDTKSRVFKAIEELNYVPNLNARSLVRRKSGLVGAIVVRDYENEGPWKKHSYGSFINELGGLLDKAGYHLLMTSSSLKKPELDIILQRELEAVFVIDVEEDFFYKISNRFTVPLIIVDSVIEDKLFHKILPDLQEAVIRAQKDINSNDTYLITDRYNDNNIMKQIFSAFSGGKENIHIMENLDGLKEFMKGKENKKGIVINEYIGVITARYTNYKNLSIISTCGDGYLLNEDSKIIEFNINKKAEKAAELMLDLLEQKYRGNQRIVVKAE